MPRLMNPDEVGDVLGVKRTKVYELMNDEGLPYVPGISKERLVIDDELWVWLKRRQVRTWKDDVESKVE